MAMTALISAPRSSPPREVCPLCLGTYLSALERTCSVCEAPSCPDCAEQLSFEHGRERFRCLACRRG